MKKIISLLVVLVLVFSSVFIFSSCSKNYDNLRIEMLNYANEKYKTEFTEVEFQKETKNSLGITYTNKLKLKRSEEHTSELQSLA